MALLDATQWNDWQDTFATSDQRFAPHGVVDVFKESTPFANYISAEARQRLATTSSLREVKIPVIIEQEVSVVETPGFEFIPDNLTESAEYNFVVVDFFSGFRQYNAQYANNTIAAVEDRNIKMTNIADAMATAMEVSAITILEARKTQVLAFTTQVNHSSGGGVYTFNAGTDTLEINEAAQQETMFSSLTELMRANKLDGQYMSLVSPAGLATQKFEALKFGDSNQKNIRALGMIPAEDMHNSHSLSAGSDIFNGFWVRKGAVGMYGNFPFDFRAGTTLADQKWSVSDVEIGPTRMQANIYTNKFAANATGLVGTGTDSNLIMTAGEEMAIWIRVYWVFKFNTDITTRANDVVKIKGLTT